MSESTDELNTTQNLFYTQLNDAIIELLEVVSKTKRISFKVVRFIHAKIRHLLSIVHQFYGSPQVNHLNLKEMIKYNFVNEWQLSCMYDYACLTADYQTCSFIRHSLRKGVPIPEINRALCVPRVVTIKPLIER